LTNKRPFIILRLKVFGGPKIKTILKTEKIPIKLWLDDIEDGALKQARNIANHPFAYRHIAIMPDAHQGYGMPIGGVMATVDVIVPNAVGVDIGCGMIAARTTCMADELDENHLNP
jgi:tRNA-splicing ligase RtcB